MAQLSKYVTENVKNLSIDEIWKHFKDCINLFVKQNVPSKLSRKTNKLPWVNKNIEKEIKKKRKLYTKYKKSGTDNNLEDFKNQTKKTQKNDKDGPLEISQ